MNASAPRSRLRRLLPAVAGLSLAMLTRAALAADPGAMLTGQVGELTPAIVQIFMLVTILAIVPSLLVMATSFTKFVVVFSVLRNALGTQQSPPNVVVVGLALFLTLFVMQPVFEKAWDVGVAPYLAGTSAPLETITHTLEPFRGFMMANVREKDLVLFQDLAASRDGPAAAEAPGATANPGEDAAAGQRPTLTTLIPAFMTSELRKAFTTAFLLFVPFLVIEMIVSSVLMAMGMMMLPPVVISLPFKLIFFVLVDGWWLLSGTLVRSYV